MDADYHADQYGERRHVDQYGERRVFALIESGVPASEKTRNDAS